MRKVSILNRFHECSQPTSETLASRSVQVWVRKMWSKVLGQKWPWQARPTRTWWRWASLWNLRQVPQLQTSPEDSYGERSLHREPIQWAIKLFEKLFEIQIWFSDMSQPKLWSIWMCLFLWLLNVFCAGLSDSKSAKTAKSLPVLPICDVFPVNVKWFFKWYFKRFSLNYWIGHPDGRYDCKKCRFKASSFLELRSHVENMHEACKFKCAECNFVTEKRRVLKTHVKR